MSNFPLFENIRFILRIKSSISCTVTIDSCTQSSLVISRTDASDGGITYIQGQGAACKQTTGSGTSQHTFDFASCGIAWVRQTVLVVVFIQEINRMNRKFRFIQEINRMKRKFWFILKGRKLCYLRN